MNLLLLSSPESGFNSNYRGTSRSPPCHWDNSPEDTEVNKLFFWYWDASDQGVIHEERLADELCRMASLYNRHEFGGEYEVIEAVAETENPSRGKEFLGIDL